MKKQKKYFIFIRSHFVISEIIVFIFLFKIFTFNNVFAFDITAFGLETQGLFSPNTIIPSQQNDKFAFELIRFLIEERGRNLNVITRRDFVNHVNTHQANVKEYAMILLKFLKKNRPGEFDNLDPHLVEKYFSLHDIPKLWEKNIDDLFKIFGKNVYDLPEKEKQAALKVIKAINKAEEQIKKAFLSKIDPKYHDILKTLEEVADIYERSLNPTTREEMGVFRNPYSYLKDPIQLVLFKHLEESVPRHAPNKRLKLTDPKLGKQKNPVTPLIPKSGIIAPDACKILFQTLY